MVAGGNDWGMYSIHAVKGYVMWGSTKLDTEG